MSHAYGIKNFQLQKRLATYPKETMQEASARARKDVRVLKSTVKRIIAKDPDFADRIAAQKKRDKIELEQQRARRRAEFDAKHPGLRQALAKKQREGKLLEKKQRQMRAERLALRKARRIQKTGSSN
jgi:hypothetical protein